MLMKVEFIISSFLIVACSYNLLSFGLVDILFHPFIVYGLIYAMLFKKNHRGAIYPLH